MYILYILEGILDTWRGGRSSERCLWSLLIVREPIDVEAHLEESGVCHSYDNSMDPLMVLVGELLIDGWTYHSMIIQMPQAWYDILSYQRLSSVLWPHPSYGILEFSGRMWALTPPYRAPDDG